jgi:hypothetical protein
MAISLIDYSTANSDGSSTDRDIRFAKPSGQNGDMFVVVITATNQGSITRSGWITVQAPDKASPDRQVRMLYKTITDYAGESSSLDFRNADSVFMQGVLMCLRGADTDTPTFVRQGQGDDEPIGSNGQTPNVITTFNNAFIVSVIANVDTSGDPNDWWGVVSGTPGMTKILDLPPHPSSAPNSYYIKAGVAVGELAVAGSTTGYAWPLVGGGEDGNEMSMTVAIKPYVSSGGGGCTCNAICDSDCAANNGVCTGHAPYCSNQYSFSTIASGTLITAAHMRELETSINNERGDSGRRFTATDPVPCASHTVVACTSNDFSQFPFTGGAVGDVKPDDDTDDVIDANNEVANDSGFGGVVPSDPSAGDLIAYLMYTGIQDKINETRTVCICDSHCSCNPADCGCNGECPGDDYFYYYP